MNIDRNELDQYITGNYGEDNFINVDMRPRKFDEVAKYARERNFRLERGSARDGSSGKPTGYVLWNLRRGLWRHYRTLTAVIDAIDLRR